MNIRICPLLRLFDRVLVACPGCQSFQCRKHGFYARKGFHVRIGGVELPMLVPRYLCLNPECPRYTFSILPPQVLRYSRFFWPCLLSLRQSLADGWSIYHQARHVWGVGWGVIRRARALLSCLERWVEGLHRELTDGGGGRDLILMVKILTTKVGRCELTERWYCHRYPARFLPAKSVTTQFSYS